MTIARVLLTREILKYNIIAPRPLRLNVLFLSNLLDFKGLCVATLGLPPTILSAAHTVQGASGNSNDFLPLQPLDLPWSSNMVIRSMAQPVIVTFAPAQKEI